jgi:Zn-finger nucleic acid-binding protein
VLCPQCTRELRINRKFDGKQVTCKHCSGEFLLDFGVDKIEKVGIYVYCPHCSERLRMSCKYIGVKVACKACSGRLTAVENTVE